MKYLTAGPISTLPRACTTSPASSGVSQNAGVLKYWPNFGPRLGFAYQLLPHTVFRGGVGLFYNASGSEAGNMRLARNLPFGLTYQTTPGDVTVGPTVSQGFPALQPIIIPPTPNGVGYSVAPNFRPSYAEQFNGGIEQEIVPLEMVLKFVGVGNLGRHLQDTWNANQPIPGSTSTVSRRPLYSLTPAERCRLLSCPTASQNTLPSSSLPTSA